MAETNTRNRVRMNTPRGVSKYPRFDAPDTKFDKDGVYKVNMSWPTEVIQPIKDKVDALAAQMKADMVKRANEETDADKKKKLKRQIAELKGYESPFKVVLDDEGEPTDRTYADFKMKSVIRWKDRQSGEEKSRVQKPKIVDAKGRPTKAVPWTGSELVIAFDAEPSYWDGQKKIGVSLKLVGAQIIKLVQGSGSREEEPEFEVYEDGFEDDGEMFADTTSTSTDTPSSPAPDADDDSGDF